MPLPETPPDGTALLTSLIPSLEFLAAPRKQLLCARCRQLALWPWLLRCGHLLCCRCMNGIQHGGTDTCPVDGEPVRQEESILKPDIDAQVRKHLVRCPYHKKGCGKVVTLAHVKNHLNNCTFIAVICPRECGLPVSRNDLVSHLVGVCPGPQSSWQANRPTRPKIAFHSSSLSIGGGMNIESSTNRKKAEDLVAASVTVHLERLTKVIEKLAKEMVGVSPRHFSNYIDSNHNVKGDFSKYGVTVPELDDGSGGSIILKTAESNLKNGHIVLPDLTQRYTPEVAEQLLSMVRVLLQKIDFLENNLVTKDYVKKLNGTSEERTEVMQTTMRHIYQKLERLESNRKLSDQRMMASLREIRESSARLHTDLLSRVEVLTESVERQRTVLLRLTDSVERPWLSEGGDEGGSFIWKIDGLALKRARAAGGSEAELFSAPFYSHRYGYKLCLRVYPYGYGDGRGTHLSVYVCLMRGNFDQLLSWPFRRRFTLRLLDLRGLGLDPAAQPAPARQDRVQVIDPTVMPRSGYTKWNRRPVQERNVGFGLPEFVPLNELDEKTGSRFVIQDTLYLKIVIDGDATLDSTA